MNSQSRPEWLPYRSKDGVFETHFFADGGFRAFSNFVERAILWSDSVQGEYKILDTFLSDSLTSDILQEVLKRSSSESPTRILLVDPNCAFALARAESIDLEAEEESLKGLRRILGSMISVATPGRDASAQIAKISRYNRSKTISLIENLGKDLSVSLRFYSAVPGGPMYFFKDLALSGRFASGVSAIELPWSMVVDDPSRKNDFYDLLCEEFDYIWNYSCLTRVGLGEYRVFLSYSEEDMEFATELRAEIEKYKISVFMACLSLDPGSLWPDEIRKELLGCSEVVALITPRSSQSQWVHAEVGAAWCLGKGVTPALAFVKAADLPTYMSARQAVSVDTDSGRSRLIKAIRKRRDEWAAG